MCIVCINARIYAWSLHALRQPAWGQQVIQSAPPFLPFVIPLFPPFLLLTLSFSFTPFGVCQTPPLGWNFALFLLFFATVYMCNVVFIECVSMSNNKNKTSKHLQRNPMHVLVLFQLYFMFRTKQPRWCHSGRSLKLNYFTGQIVYFNPKIESSSNNKLNCKIKPCATFYHFKVNLYASCYWLNLDHIIICWHFWC